MNDGVCVCVCECMMRVALQDENIPVPAPQAHSTHKHIKLVKKGAYNISKVRYQILSSAYDTHTHTEIVHRVGLCVCARKDNAHNLA